MSRLSRKNRNDIIYKGCGGVYDMLDDSIKSQWRINDAEYDYIATNANEEELDLFLKEDLSISDKKRALGAIDELIDRCKNGL